MTTLDSPIARLPLMQWAARFRGGDFRIQGFSQQHMDLSLGPFLLRVGAGEVQIRGSFIGQKTPEIRQFEIRAARLECPNGPLGSWVLIEPRRISWQGGELAWLEKASLRELGYECLGALSNLRIELTARANAAWQLDLGGGVSLDIRRDALVELKGATLGDAARIQLCEPMEIRCEDVTVQLGSGQFRALSRLARVRLTGATLHPDGSVRLKGGSRRGLNRAIQGGLSRASRGISNIVRQNVRIRRFLSSTG
jgi:hypothetical protein